MKRILLIATVQSHIAQFHKPLMQLLKEHGWEIHVAARDNLSEKNGLSLEYPDKVFDIPFQRSPFDSRNLKAYRQLKELLKNEHYDVIHCNTPVGGMLGRLAAKKYRCLGTKVFYTAHGFHFYKGAPLKNWLIFYPIERVMSHFTDRLITITQEDYSIAKRKFHCDVYRTHGVGVDEQRYCIVNSLEKERLKQVMGFNGPVILNIGELRPNKNQSMALLMMKKVIAEHPSALLIIAGNGPDEDNLKELATKLNIQKNVRFIGYCVNLQDYQHIADVSVACSYREGLPLNIVESMMSGTLVIASNNRGHKELILNGKTGFIVDVNDVDGMANLVTDALNNPVDYQMLLNAAKDSSKQYGKDAVKEELKRVYDF